MLGSGDGQQREQIASVLVGPSNGKGSQTNQQIIKWVTYKLWLNQCPSLGWSKTELLFTALWLTCPWTLILGWYHYRLPKPQTWGILDFHFLLQSSQSLGLVCVFRVDGQDWLHPEPFPHFFWALPMWWWQKASTKTQCLVKAQKRKAKRASGVLKGTAERGLFCPLDWRVWRWLLLCGRTWENKDRGKSPCDNKYHF